MEARKCSYCKKEKNGEFIRGIFYCLDCLAKAWGWNKDLQKNPGIIENSSNQNKLDYVIQGFEEILELLKKARTLVE